MKPKVLLYNHDGLGLIIDFPSGVIYSNQAGGHACLQPEMEGIFAPLSNDAWPISPTDELVPYFTGDKYRGSGATSGIDEEDAAFIERILRKHRPNDDIKVDRTKLRESYEAWIHVEVLDNGSGSNEEFPGFGPYPRSAVLTWPNSD